MLLKSELVHICTFLVFFGICAESTSWEKIKFLSYNAAMLDASISQYDQSIPNNREERLETLTEYLKSQTKVDIVCLQEIYFAQDAERIVNEVRTKFPYSFSGLHLADGTLPPQSTADLEPSCEPEDFNEFILCAMAKGCISVKSAKVDAPVYQCLVNSCPAEFEKLIRSGGENCLGCLITNSPSNFLPKCASPTSPTRWKMNKLGLLLLSNRDMTETSAVDFFPEVTNILAKGYLKAKIDDVLTLACVQAVPTTFNFPPLDRQFSNFSEQNAAELQMLADSFSGPDVTPFCAIGDFNAGPTSESLDPIEEPNYKILTDAFHTKLVLNGTFSSKNPYNAGGPVDYSRATDHLFCQGVVDIISTEKRLQYKRLKGPQKLPMSDHWGLRAAINVRYP